VIEIATPRARWHIFRLGLAGHPRSPVATLCKNPHGHGAHCGGGMRAH